MSTNTKEYKKESVPCAIHETNPLLYSNCLQSPSQLVVEEDTEIPEKIAKKIRVVDEEHSKDKEVNNIKGHTTRSAFLSTFY